MKLKEYNDLSIKKKAKKKHKIKTRLGNSIKKSKGKEELVREVKVNNKVVLSNLLLDEKNFKETKDWLILNQEDFTYYMAGSSDRIKWGEKIFTCRSEGSFVDKGFHLSKIVKQDVDYWITNNWHDKLVERQSVDRMQQLVNLEAVEKAIKEDDYVTSIDLDGCYWETAYKMGFISFRTYIMGSKKEEWKVGRNASIGSLSKREIIIPYKNGAPDNANRYISESSKERQWVRNAIIGHVFDMFAELYCSIPDDFLVYLTDCVFINNRKFRYVLDFFHKKGYEFKIKTVQLTELDKKTGSVSWKELAKDKSKYFVFSRHQRLDNLDHPEDIILNPITPKNKRR